MVVSAQKDDEGNHVSRWAKSYRYKRQKPVRELWTLDRRLWGNPASKLKFVAGRPHVSKYVRTKQWLAAQNVWQCLRTSMLQWLNINPDWGVDWVGICPYDPWLDISVLNDMVNQDRDTATQMVVITLYVGMVKNNAGDMVQHHMDKGRVDTYIQHKGLEHVRGLIQSGKLKKCIDETNLLLLGVTPWSQTRLSQPSTWRN
ncbi:hypothetical protein N9L68_04595 [bacterium]|nr:hypothetical protein [bacterium]